MSVFSLFHYFPPFLLHSVKWAVVGWAKGLTEPNEFYDELLRLLLIYVCFVCVLLAENA